MDRTSFLLALILLHGLGYFLFIWRNEQVAARPSYVLSVFNEFAQRGTDQESEFALKFTTKFYTQENSISKSLLESHGNR